MKLPHNWQGDKKKVEIRDETLISEVFQLASLMRVDFTAAIHRILITSVQRCIQEEIYFQQRLSTPVGGGVNPLAECRYSTHLAQPPTDAEKTPAPQKTSATLSGASLI